MSEEKRRSRGRRQFGFDGPRKRSPAQDKEVSVDDILDSLSRRAQLSEKLDPVETIMEEELGERFAPESLTRQFTKESRQRSFGRYAFALMLVGGLIIVGLYGALKAITDPSGVLGIVENPTLKTVFTDPARLGLAALFCLISVLIVRHRRAAQNRLLKR